MTCKRLALVLVVLTTAISMARVRYLENCVLILRSGIDRTHHGGYGGWLVTEEKR